MNFWETAKASPLIILVPGSGRGAAQYLLIGIDYRGIVGDALRWLERWLHVSQHIRYVLYTVSLELIILSVYVDIISHRKLDSSGDFDNPEAPC